MSNQLDPFSLTYNALWRLVERNVALRSMVKTGNRIKYTNQDRPKTEISHADTPELALTVGGARFNERNNTTSTGLTKIFTWGVVSGDEVINEVYHPIQWELYRSMMDWRCELCKLEWCNCKFVQDCQLLTAEEGKLFEDLNRDIQGWAALMNVEVQMTFGLANIKIKVA